MSTRYDANMSGLQGSLQADRPRQIFSEVPTAFLLAFRIINFWSNKV